ncbi:MAG TPA: GNAT family N-acetyltransferase [Vicinamibacterales bacterium]|nr:GNAT family N-acetyltransferase [Vicinamibacterales bacterium]
MTIRTIVEGDRIEWRRLRQSLWPGSDHDDETRAYFANRLTVPRVFVAEIEGRLVGFLELDYRKYAPGCTSSPVAFIEGWHVEPGFQGQGIGRALMAAAWAHALAAGQDEIASDTEVDNVGGVGAHLALGFEEIERVVCFRRSLRDS